MKYYFQFIVIIQLIIIIYNLYNLRHISRLKLLISYPHLIIYNINTIFCLEFILNNKIIPSILIEFQSN